MTRAEMDARIASILDSTVGAATHWTTTEVDAALSDGQREVVNFVLAMYLIKKQVMPNLELPETLRPLQTAAVSTLSVGQNNFNVPADFLKELYAEYNPAATTSLAPCFKRETNEVFPFEKANTYLTGSAGGRYYYLTGSTVRFEDTASATAGYNFVYLKRPTEISGSVEPILLPFTHEAIVFWAAAFLLGKDQKTRGDSALYLQQFLQLVQNFN